MDSKDRPLDSVPAVASRKPLPMPMMPDPTMGRPGGAESHVGSNILRVAFRAIRRHWWQIILLWGIISGGLVYAINANMKPQYESASLLRVEPTRRQLFNGGPAENFEPYLETQ